MLYKDISLNSTRQLTMRFFTNEDRQLAIELMLRHVDLADRSLLGALGGIKRRARARAVIAFGQRLTPRPPDKSITTMRTILREIFGGRGISTNDLHRYFSTAGRKADDRVDLAALRGWFDENRGRFESDAERLMLDLDEAWKLFTADAAREAGELRRAK